MDAPQPPRSPDASPADPSLQQPSHRRSARPNVWTIPPGRPFLDSFVDAFLAGRIVALPDAGDPLSLAQARIYVPTQRSARALADSFRAHAAARGASAAVLPRILALGDLEATAAELAFAEPGDASNLAGFADPDLADPRRVASTIWRRLHLATLIKGWADAIGGALRTVDPHGEKVVDEGEAFRVATSTADAYALAEDLGALIDELAIEGVAWHRLDELHMADFDDYWRITTTFLDVAIEQWPKVLAANGRVDKVERQIALVEAQARALADDAVEGPVVAIGSTGTNAATARLLAAIARSACGAVVLPGLDREMDDAAHAIVSGTLQRGQEPGFGHPQAAMARLLPHLGLGRAEVRELGEVSPEMALRGRFVAEALRPADTTDLWRDWRRRTSSALLTAALAGVTLVEAQARALADDAVEGPVVAIGSTGTNAATARLLAAIARSACGAVVLPGLDREMDDAAHAIVSGTLQRGQEPGFGHPQAAMARLLPHLGLGRAEVRELGEVSPEMALRGRFVAEALRPADTTDLWRDWRRRTSSASLAAALAGVTLVEAADEREEALCLAVALREVLETPGRTAALVTPDRELARRVRGELLRWEIEVSDTGGEPLANRPLGVLARLVAAAAVDARQDRAGAGRPTARDIGAVLAHSLVTLGRPRLAVARLAAMLEVGVLRAVVPGDRDTAALFAEARRLASDRHAHPAQAAIDAEGWAALAELWDDLAQALGPLLAIDGERPLPVFVAAHRSALAALVDEAAPDEVAALEAIFAELEADGGAFLPFDVEGYAVLFARICRETALRNTERPHPRLAIYGLIEARLMRADVTLLGGLDETVWPPQAQSDAFLNRPMRGDLGLSPPERRIGQTAHDFAQGMGAAKVVLSRAVKRGNAPTVASRFLLRCEALGGRDWAACRARGTELLALARMLDRSAGMPAPAKRPQPRPPLELRPTRLSVTEIETLRRDPYAIHAAHVLKLKPLPQVDGELDAGEFGSLLHGALQRFVEHGAVGASPARRRASLEGIARETFAEALADPVFLAFRWPAISRALDVFLGYDAEQRPSLAETETEKGAKVVLTLADTTAFTLTARADRIDRHRDGAVTLIDYKSGQPPGLREVQVGFAPQLTLEAAMLREGGFGKAHRGAVAATYLKLGGKAGGFVRSLDFKDEPFAAVVDRHWAQLHSLLSAFRSAETAYPSRPYPKYARSHGDYDHLARVREWSLAGDGES